MTAPTPRPPMKPRDIRRRAYSLMRQCWLTLLIAAVLISLPGWVKTAVETHGEKIALEVYNTRMEAFHAENPAPSEEETQRHNAKMDALDALINGDDSAMDNVITPSADTTNYYLKMYAAQRDAYEQYEKAFTPWEWAGRAIDLFDILLTGVIVVRLCRGLLNGLGTGTCSPRCLLDGRKRTLTSCWMALQIPLLVLVWILLPLALTILLSSIFGRPGELIGLILVLFVSIWADLRYSLAVVHLADGPESGCTASDCLSWATDDMNLFTIRSLFCTIWPLFAVVLVVDFLLPLFVPLFPALDLPVAIFIILSHIFIFAAEYTCYVCIYDEIRQRIRAAEEATPPTEGLARARALANGESIT